ncbi:MAG TPA: glycogen debranching enzyme N-terminal domain-containing protein [Thermoanaerobaculia bacterium]|nr:glycogen debranching enzyme N-terminal domain-containing protein [Thermoanaerobaculia bacterium]
MIEIDREITQDFDRASGLEWLETNGLGGWAGTTVAGAHSRRYHGLLVAATQPPAERTVLLSRLDETLHVEGESFELSCNQFPGVVIPRGFEHLTSFRKDLFPVFEFEAGGVKLRKTVAAVDGENTTLVLYEVLEAPGPFILSLRPFLAARDQHALSAANPKINEESPFEDGILSLRPYPDVPELFVQVPGADFRQNPQWWYRFEYEAERRRGADFQEDLWTPGVLGLEMAAEDRLGIVVSTRNPAGRDAFALFEKERKRREKVLKALPVQDDFARHLALAADGFVVRRGPNQRAVLAGYPGFGEQSRDTMIALPGLCLVTGRHEDAKKILRDFAKGVFKKEEPEHTSADAPLWLFVAAWKYLQTTGDEAFVRETLLPALRKVVRAYSKGTLHGIQVSDDGLLSAGGKSVEVNALWYNALAILSEIEARLGDPKEASRLGKSAKRVQKRFQEAFWNEEAGCLYGLIDGGPDGDERDDSFRPRQIFALSLPFPLLPKPKAARVLAAVEADSQRSGAWPFGPYFTALVRVHGAAGRKKALLAVEELKSRLAEDPMAQAWSVAEVLRAYVEDLQKAPVKA